MGSFVKVFAGSSCTVLAKGLSSFLELPLGDALVGRFSDGEIAVSLNENVRNCACVIVQSTCAPVNDNLMELLVFADALKRAGAGRILAVVPYFGYARQDRISKNYEPITAKLVANLISVSGISEVLTVDLHVPQLVGFFDIPVTVLNGQRFLAACIKDFMINEISDFVVVSPDLGSLKRAKFFSSLLGNLPVVVVDKVRSKANECGINGIFGDVANKKVLIVDDIVDTAGTLCNVASALVSRGAKSVYACATHGVLSGPARDRLNGSNIETVFLLDTIPLALGNTVKKLKFFSVCGDLGSALKNMLY